MKTYATLFVILNLLFSTVFTSDSSSDSSSLSSSSLKISKSTIDTLNNGLKVLVNIKRILNTLKSVNELTGNAFPAALASTAVGKQRLRLIGKLLGIVGSSPSASGSSTNNDGTSNTILSTKRNPTNVGLIKIGEKPPPGPSIHSMITPFHSNRHKHSLPMMDRHIPDPPTALFGAPAAISEHYNAIPSTSISAMYGAPHDHHQQHHQSINQQIYQDHLFDSAYDSFRK
ncbi:hypothetical protein RDWZM_002239 [Blomia tropicalis]|uniref:Uncharacterized protein n=1 Tax=Blomia tropicalis TaxID=40697 RepID=A0A9Q0MDI2_BLOTA|nr:hypothetical protein RDWZM_002239 [Blomia tropicalis]